MKKVLGIELGSTRIKSVLIDENACGVDYNDNDKVDTLIYYFESGKMQKNQAITFGETTIGIDKDGLVIGLNKTEGDDNVKVAGVEYKFLDNTENYLALDTYTICGITKK